MLKYPADFVFFNDVHTGAPDGWRETLTVLRDPKDHEAVNDLIRCLVSFASEHSLSGNIWHCWLTYMMMMHENAFTEACERREIDIDSTLFKIAEADFEIIRNFFMLDLKEFNILSLTTDYRSPYPEKKPDRIGKIVHSLSKELSNCDSSFSFACCMINFYTKFGIGIYSISRAFRVLEETDGSIKLVPVMDDSDVTFDQLVGLEAQKKTLCENTEAFLNGRAANNVLLYGDSGTGKSTSVHALMHEYYNRGLRLVELSKQERCLLPRLMAAIKKRNYHFIIYLDDLSFEENESDYKELKAMLEGALEKRSDRILIYATSNRRHLIRETWKDRNDMEYQNDIHHSDTMEEKLSLASRFGVTIYYSKPDAKEYLHIVHTLAERNGLTQGEKELNDRARQWELRHGGMSGRTASQFITWLAGEQAPKD